MGLSVLAAPVDQCRGAIHSALDLDPVWPVVTALFQIGTDKQLGVVFDEQKGVKPAKGAIEVKWALTRLDPGGR